jgi:sugar (pentulose or hexulose) kinase
MINLAKGIFFVKETYPERFKNTTHILLYPQYWGYRFTGKIGMEGTYIGCHTYLWDQIENKLSSVAEGLGIKNIMSRKLSNSWDIIGRISKEFACKTGLNRDVIVTMGIHDSNSSLLPHFVKKGETGFVLNSTGTWCVLMNPVKQYVFAQEELGKMVFFNISAFKKPVKTAIFLGGQEFEIWSGILMDHHGIKELPQYNEELYRSILREKNAFLLPELSPGSGQFPFSKARIVENRKEYLYADIAKTTRDPTASPLPQSFKNFERGIALLKISLIMQTFTALDRIGLTPGMELFTEGGFRKDIAYNTLVSAYYPDNPVYLSDIAEATAFGAAITAKMALTGKQLSDISKDFEIVYQKVKKINIPEIQSYRDAWLTHT